MNTPSRTIAVVCLLVLGCVANVRADGKGQADLDKAMSLKIKATKLQQLSEVADLCESAIKKGLDADSEQFARRLLVGALYQRAEQLTNTMIENALSGSGWKKLRASALNDLKRIIKYDAHFAEAYLMIARLQMLPDGDRKAADEAIAQAIKFLEASDDKETLSQAYVLRAEMLSDASKQLAILNKAIALDPMNVQALEARAHFYQKQGKHEKALQDLRDVLTKRDDVRARLAVIEALTNLKQYQEALDQMNILIKQRPSFIAYALRAQLYARLGKNDLAIKDCGRALKDNPNDLSARMLRAQLYYQQHRYALAADDIRFVLTVRPGLPQALGLSALIHAGQGDFNKAVGLLRAVIKEQPSEVGWKLQLGAVYQLANKPRQAIAVYDQILKSDPDQADALRNRGDVWLALGNHVQAVQDYQHALKLTPDNTILLNNLAWVLATSPDQQVRNGKQALELATKAAEKTKYKEAYILSTLAAAYAETGDFQSALKWSEKAVKLSNDKQRAQLQHELESYQKHKPWREKQSVSKDVKAKPAKDKS